MLLALTLGLKDNPLVPIGPGSTRASCSASPRCSALALVVAGLGRAATAAPATGDARSRGATTRWSRSRSRVFACTTSRCCRSSASASRPSLSSRRSNALLEPPATRAMGCGIDAVALVATAVVTYLVFERYLSVLLPRGRWTDF